MSGFHTIYWYKLFMFSIDQCSQGSGACPDVKLQGSDNTELISWERSDGILRVDYKRPLASSKFIIIINFIMNTQFFITNIQLSTSKPFNWYASHMLFSSLTSAWMILQMHKFSDCQRLPSESYGSRRQVYTISII